MIFLSHQSWINDFGLFRCFTALRSIFFKGIDCLFSRKNLTKNNVLAIEPWGLFERDEELWSVCVWSSVSWWKQVWLGVVELEVLVIEFLTIDWFATCSITISEITSLCHETWNNSMEWWMFICQILSRDFALSIFSWAEMGEVLGCLWNNLAVKTHNYSLLLLTINFNIEKAFICNFR